MIQDSEPKCDECGHILPLAGPCANCGTRPKGLHVYIAGSFRDRERVRKCMRAARARGLHVVHDWPAMIESVPGEDSDVPDDEARQHALADIEAIRGANVLWLLAPPEGQGRGSWVEWGVALERNTPIIASGEHVRGSIFTAVGERYDTDEDALEALMLYSREPDPVPYEDATGNTYPAKGVWQNPERQGGKPCIEGTRIPTATIRRCLVGGWSVDRILDEYPNLDRGQVEGALRFELGRDPESGGASKRPTQAMYEGTEARDTAAAKIDGLPAGASSYVVGAQWDYEDPIEALYQYLDTCAPFVGCGMDMCIGAAGSVEVRAVTCEGRAEQSVTLSPQEVYELLRSERPEHWTPEGGDDDEDPDDEPDTTVEHHSEWLLSLRGRLAKAEKQIESIDCAIAGAVTRLSGRIGEVEETGRIHDQTFSAILDRLIAVERGLTRLNDAADDLSKRLRAVDSYGADALQEALRELGWQHRLERLERDLAKLRAGGAPESRREHATAAFAYVCGRTRKPMPGGEVPSCGEPVPGAEGVACPFPAPCPYHVTASKEPASREDAAE